MPSAKSARDVLKSVLAGNPVTDDQILGVIEYHRSIIVNHMRDFTPKTLGELACLGSGNSTNMCHILLHDEPEVSVDHELPPLSLKTQGIFAGTPLATRTRTDRYTTFGIDRAGGNWLLIEIEFSKDKKLPGYEKAKRVTILKIDLRTMLEETNLSAHHILMFFRTAVNNWASACKQRFETADEVSKRLEKEIEDFNLIAP